MIVKVQHFKDNVIGVWEEEIYSNVEKVFRFRDKNNDEFLNLQIKGQEHLELIPITHIIVDEETTEKAVGHEALVGAIWLMNDEGKTIEKLV